MKIVKLCPFCGSDKIEATPIVLEPNFCNKCRKYFDRPLLYMNEEKELKKIADNIAKTNKKLTELKSELKKGVRGISDNLLEIYKLFKE